MAEAKKIKLVSLPRFFLATTQLILPVFFHAPKREYALKRGVLLWIAMGLSFCTFGQTTVLSNPGVTYTNSDRVTSNTYSANVANCSSISFSMNYAFSLPWSGDGNMESSDECTISCAGDVTSGPSAGGCFACWDFIYVRYQLDGVTVFSDVVGEAGTTDSEQTGSFNFGPICTNGATTATIIVQTQTWASDESINFNNIRVQCWDARSTLMATPNPVCGTLPSTIRAVLLNPSSVASQQWTGPGTIADPNALITTVSNLPQGVNTLTFTATDQNGCTRTNSIDITANPSTFVDPVAPLSVCGGGQIQVNFTSTSPTAVYNWTSTNPNTGMPTSGTGNIDVPANTVTTAQTSIISVRANDGGCIGPVRQVQVTVNPLPTVNNVANVVRCAGQNVTVNFSGTGGPTFDWTNDNPAIGLSGSGTGNIPAFTAAAPNGTPEVATITVTPRNASCTGIPKTFTITVNPLPTIIDPPDITVCPGDPINVAFSGSSGTATYAWTNTNPSIGVASSGTGDIMATATGGAVPISGIITVRANENSCTSNPQLFTVVVSPAPVMSAVSNVVRCPGQSVSIVFGGTTGAVFEWSNSNTTTGLSVASGTGNINFTAANVATTQVSNITVTPRFGTCSGTPQNFTITISPGGPSVIKPANQSFCSSDSIKIRFTGSSPTAIYTWSNSNTTLGISANGTGNIIVKSAAVTAVQTGTFTVTASEGGCAGTPQNFTITVAPPPDVSQPADATACSDQSVIVAFAGSTGATFNWTNSNTTIGLGASGSGNLNFMSINNGNTPQTATITVTPVIGSCMGTVRTFTITVNPIPTVLQPVNTAVCAGQNINVVFSGSSGAVFNWANSNTAIGLGASGSGNLNFTGTNTGNTPQMASITVTPVFGTCPGIATTFAVTVNPTASVTKPADLSLCGNNPISVIFSGSSPTATYSWSNNNTAIGIGASGSGNITGTVAAVTAVQTGIVTVTPFENGCPGTAQNFNVTVNPSPSVTQPANTSVCAGQNINIAFAGSAGTTFNWTNSNTSIGLGASGSGNLNFAGVNTGNTAQTATIAVTPTAGTCTGQQRTFTITVTPLVSVNDPADVAVCSGAPVAVAFTGTASTYNWSNSNTAIGLAASGSGNINFNALSSGSATVTVTPVGTGCPGPAQTFVITVTNSLTMNPVSNISQCSGDSIKVNFTGTPGAVYQWSNSNTAIGLPANGTGNLNFASLVSTTTQTANITVTPSAGGCSGTPTTFSITVNPGLTTAISGAQSVCAGNSTTLSASTGNTFLWNSGQTTQSITVSPVANTTFTVTVRNASGCTATASALVRVNVGQGQTLIRTTCNPALAVTTTQTFKNQFGCDSVVTTITTLSPSDTIRVSKTTCDPQMAGTKTDRLKNRFNCDSLIITTTTLLRRDTIRLTRTTCIFAQAGVTTERLTNRVGCDSLIITTTNLLPTDTTKINKVTCNMANEGVVVQHLPQVNGCDSVIITTTTFSPAGGDTTRLFGKTCDPALAITVTKSLKNRFGCDSLVITTTTLLPKDTVRLNQTTCTGPAGITVQHLKNRFTCDSVVITTTTLLPKDTVRLNRTTCTGPAGITVQNLKNRFTCDSVVITTTTLLPKDTVRLSRTTCTGPAGTTVQNLNNRFGCDSVVITTTTLLPKDTVRLSRTTCTGPAGTTVQNLNNRFGCDSVVITTTTLLPKDTVRLSRTTCIAGQAGTTMQHLNNRFGCDSLVITTTTLLPTDTTRISRKSCNPANVGVKTQILPQLNGCDSVLIITTTFDPAGRDTTILFARTCDPSKEGMTQKIDKGSSGCDSLTITFTTLSPTDTVRLFKTTCTKGQDGIVIQHLNNRFTCDSVVITTTTLLPNDTVRLSRTTCIAGQAGTTMQHLNNRFGCDSLVITTTTLLPTDTTRISRRSCNPANVGVKTQILPQLNGCDSVLIITTTFDPAGRDTTILFARTCDPSKAGMTQKIDKGSSGCDSLTITFTTLSRRDTTRLSRRTCDPLLAGTTMQHLPNIFGCDSLVITTTTLSPRDTILLSRTTCNPALAGVTTDRLKNRFGCDSLIVTTTTLLRQDTTRLSLTTCNPAQAGSVTKVLVNRLGCDSLVITTTTYNAAQCAGQALLTARPATCSDRSDGSAVITVNSGVPPFNYNWVSSTGTTGTGQITALNAPVTVPNLAPGEFKVTISQPNIPGGSSYTVNIPAPGPVIARASATLPAPPYAFRCAGTADGTAQVIVSGGTGPYQYVWSNNLQTAVVANVGPGIYTVTVTDQNRCTAVSAVTLRAPEPIDLAIDVNVPKCGSLQTSAFVNIDGGVAPFVIKVNGNIVPKPFVSIGSGNNLIEITDRNGCTADTTVNVHILPVILVSLPKDTTIRLGQILTLEAQTNLSATAIDTIIWSPLPDSAGHLSQTWKPFRSQIYRVTISDTVGCKATAQIKVIVRRDVDIFVPNAFSPNGDGTHDLLTISAGDGVKDLELLRIFDRWGNQVYEWKEPIAPNFWPGWDGKTGGESVGVGVYVYYLKARLENGETVERKGSVTVVR